MTGLTHRQRGARERVDRRANDWGEAVAWLLRAVTGFPVERPVGFRQLNRMSDIHGVPNWSLALFPAYRRDWTETMRQARIVAADDGMPFGAAVLFRKGRAAEQQLVAVELEMFARALAGDLTPATSTPAPDPTPTEAKQENNAVRGREFRDEVVSFLRLTTSLPAAVRGALDVNYHAAGSIGGVPGWTLTSGANLLDRDHAERLDFAEVAARADGNRLAGAVIQRPGLPVGHAVVLVSLRTFGTWIGEPR